jgi:hypothetical protein
MESQMGMVPEFEAREASRYCLLPWTTYKTLPSDERAFIIAHYRMHLMVDRHLNDAAEKYSESERRKAETKRGAGRRG